MEITFGSGCSGIEAASVAWGPLGWNAVWLAEIEAAPSTLLAYHYPNVPNVGDMKLIPQLLRNNYILAPDVWAAGTPCQAFSLAGLRNSLDDARGNLSLTYCEIANEIDTQRAANGLLPCVAVWENVPGVLSTKDNAFGCFLAGLAGEDEALVPEPCPPAGKSSRYWKWDKKSGQHALSWPKSGCVVGPQRTVAWRLLDAQYFGLAQRRKRVFVVASAREGFDPAAVLFEFDGVRRDSPPSRGAAQNPAAGTLRSSDGGSDLDHARAGHIQPVAFGGNRTSGSIEVAPALLAQSGSGYKNDFETETMIVAGTLTASYGEQSGRDLAEMPGGLQVASVALRGRDGGATAELGDDLAGCLRASSGGGDKPHVLAPIAFDCRQNPVSSTEVFGALGSSSPQAQAVAFSCKDYGADATVELAPTMRAMGHADSHANAGGQLAVTYAIQAGALRTNPNSGPDGVGVQEDQAYTLEARAEVQAVCITGDITHTLKAEGFDASEDGTGRGQPIVNTTGALCAHTYSGGMGGRVDMAAQGYAQPVGMAVRRLMPIECERLQGFPDNYTLVPLPDRRKDSRGGQRMMADGPRYKALGNSWPVFTVRWLGRRIQRELERIAA